MPSSKKKIISIASGKGGVGKSIIATNIAAGLAELGNKVILVDADFGGSNLHALLNVPPKGVGIKKFIFSDGSYSLKNGAIQDTSIENLQLVPGWDYLGLHGLKKEHIISLKGCFELMEADYLIVDLSPGISQNVLDLYDHSDIGIVILTPELTSNLNALVFLRYVLLKKIFRHVTANKEIVKLVKTAMFPSTPITISNILGNIKKIDPEIWQKLNEYLNGFKPAVIINRISDIDEEKLGNQFYEYVQKNYSVNLRILGGLKESQVVVDSVNKRVPFIIDHPDSDPSARIKTILHKLLYSL